MGHSCLLMKGEDEFLGKWVGENKLGLGHIRDRKKRIMQKGEIVRSLHGANGTGFFLNARMHGYANNKKIKKGM